MPGRREGWAEKAVEVEERIMGEEEEEGVVLWQEEVGCGEGKRTEDRRVWQEVKSCFRLFYPEG